MLFLYYTHFTRDETSSTSIEVEYRAFDMSRVHSVKLRQSYMPSAELTFSVVARQHERPIPPRAHVIFYDSDFSTDLTRPVFEGHVVEIKPVESNRVEYHCYSSDMRARQEVTVMNGPHADPASIPRLVYNTTIDTDEDNAHVFRRRASVGVMLRDMLTFAYSELTSLCHAAPPPMIGGPAYIESELVPLSFIPQEKIVFETEKLGQAIDRLMATYHPQYRLWFEPGLHPTGRKWRVRNTKTSPAVTLTLNDFEGPYHVYSVSLASSREGRATAVAIYGPPRPMFEIVYWRNQHVEDPRSEASSMSILGGGLTELWSAQQAANFRAFGPYARPEAIGNAGKTWQITDPAKRRLARILPFEVVIPIDEFNFLGTQLLFKRTRNPTFQVTFNDGRTWVPCNGARLDLLNGIIDLPYHCWQGANYESSVEQPSSSASNINQYRLPDNARFYFAYYGPALIARAPASGWEGTAFTREDMRVEDRRYDESLAIGYEAGGPVLTTPERIAQFQTLAGEILESKKDVIYTGGATLAGIQYDFWGLNKRINFAGVDGDGRPVTTGWEAINTVLSEVEYDYEEGMTTLVLNSDQMEFTQQDPDKLKSELKIHAQEIAIVERLNIGVGKRLRNYEVVVLENGRRVGKL